MGMGYLAFDIPAALAVIILYGLFMLIAGLVYFFLMGVIVVLLLVKVCSSLKVSVKISKLHNHAALVDVERYYSY